MPTATKDRRPGGRGKIAKAQDVVVVILVPADPAFAFLRGKFRRHGVPRCLPAGARPDALSGHYPAFGYYAVLGLLLGHRPSSFRSPAYRQSPEPSRPPWVKR